jgi:hypothetical protein
MTTDEAIEELRSAHASLADLWDECDLDGEECIWNDRDGGSWSYRCETHRDLDRVGAAIETLERALAGRTPLDGGDTMTREGAG